MKTVIIAAGRGTRLWEKTFRLPKTLLPFGEGTLISQILSNFSSVGITEFIIVIGFQGERVRHYLAEHDSFGFHITFVENKEWHRGNGISVRAAQSKLQRDEEFILSMSDHVVSPEALEKVRKAKSDKNLLLVDPRLEDVYDLEDATKVQFQDNRILDIGKELLQFNGVDCGVFRLNHLFFQAAKMQIAVNKESISEAARLLIEEDQFAPVIIPESSFWIDIDTPDSYENALAFKEKFL